MKEIPKSLAAVIFIMTILSILLHITQENSLNLEILDEKRLKILEILLKRFIICLVLILNLLSFYFGNLFAFISSLPLLLFPSVANKKDYYESLLIANEDLYWTNNLMVQGLITLRFVGFSIFLVFDK
jgi:hypothetical protein